MSFLEIRFSEKRFSKSRFWKVVFRKVVFGKSFFEKTFLESRFSEKRGDVCGTSEVFRRHLQRFARGAHESKKEHTPGAPNPKPILGGFS